MQDSVETIDGRFRLVRSVGSGGMGMVYLAIDEASQREVAVKVLRAAVVHSLEARLQLSREIEVLSRLRSPYIAELYSAGYLPDHSPYFVMEYIDGRDLKAELGRRSQLPFAEVAAYLVQACRGLAVAHAQGIVHRDLKPHNLIVTCLDGVRQLKIVDFAVAKILSVADRGLTASDTAVGTPLYVCPELLLNPRATSARSDVWSLGVILYELLAGFSPFADESPGAVVAAVTLDEAVPIQQLRPDIPKNVAELIDQALAKVPSRRTASVEEFERQLLPFATPLEQLIVADKAPSGPPGVVQRPSRRRGNFDLRREIRSTTDTRDAESEDEMLRRIRVASRAADPNGSDQMRRLPSIGHLSEHPEVPRGDNSPSGGNRRGDSLTWLVDRARNPTSLAGGLFVLGLFAAIYLTSRWRPNRIASSSDVMHAPSRSAPSRLTGVVMHPMQIGTAPPSADLPVATTIGTPSIAGEPAPNSSSERVQVIPASLAKRWKLK